MDDVEQKMNLLKEKKDPGEQDVRKYVRYLLNVKKHSEEQVKDDLKHWKPAMVESAIKDVERENQKPRPQRYYVSLKEPLEDGSLK
ncbi:MAG: hypothetical protein NDI94_05010 [Candidatus Woesearchaeota archaeon]|nr:hypothetical protein [Candidatus Woesearchaeota archaeon]